MNMIAELVQRASECIVECLVRRLDERAIVCGLVSRGLNGSMPVGIVLGNSLGLIDGHINRAYLIAESLLLVKIGSP